MTYDDFSAFLQETVVPLRLQTHWNSNGSEVQNCTLFSLHTKDDLANTSICPCECMKRWYFSLLFTIEIQIFERIHQFSNLILDWKH